MKIKAKKIDGRRLAKARDKFFEERKEVLLVGSASGEFLKNRLAVAFIAGYNAGANSESGESKCIN